MRRLIGSLAVVQAIVVGLLVLLPASASAAPPGQAGDFNGDGFADLVVGVPNEDIGDFSSAGGVNVIYGSAAGLSATTDPDNFFSQTACGEAWEEEEQYGISVASGDLNGDGYDDLAFGGPGESVGAAEKAGAVCVLYGSVDRLTMAGAQLWHQNVAGVEGGAETGDFFGASLAIGDFNLDGYGDLAVGVPGEDVSVADAGAVNVLYGSAAGLSAAGDQVWTQNSPGVLDVSETGDRFGLSLAAANFGNGAHHDLAIGVPFEDFLARPDIIDAGAVNVLYGSAAGLTSTGDQVWSQNSPGVEGGAETGDRFGNSLAAANFGKGGTADLAIGVPFEDVSFVDAGAVNVLYGTSAGLSAAGDQVWTQNSPGVKGGAETGDLFGFSLAAGNLGNGKLADLAIGIPSEDVGEVGAGAVAVLYGSSSSGLQASNDQLWTLDSAGLAGPGSSADSQFGLAVRIGAYGNGGPSDLAVGAPGEAVGRVPAAGTVRVLYGTSTGAATAGSQFWHQNVTSVEDVAEELDLFGFAL
ncbi:MAG: FG-GAP repeat protein [Actinobacteria bacterium]|nr:FG-GAP repeat protein [Actinomycetota bacterium]